MGGYEEQSKLRGYLARNRVNGQLNGPQQAAWDALNEIEQLVQLLKEIQRAGLTPDVTSSIRLMIERNVPEWARKTENR